MSKNTHKTAIARRSPSAPVKWLYANNMLNGQVLDYGCGRGFDSDYYGFKKYDPYYFPDQDVLKNRFDTVVCVYVLNVIDISEEKQVIEKISSILNEGGRAYFAVRRDLVSSEIKMNGYCQRLVTLNFPSVVKTKTFEIYVLEEKKHEDSKY